MIKQNVVKCNLCKEKILLRFQLGYFDIPFDFYCPNCNVSISGKLLINNNILILKNAIDLEEDNSKVKYYGNFSTEFPCKKISKFKSLSEMIEDGIGPFIDTSILFDNFDVYNKSIRKIFNFVEFKNKKWNDLKPLYELFQNNRIDLLKFPLLRFSENYIVKNNLDVTMALHQLTLIGMSNIMPTNTLKEYIELSNKMLCEDNIKEVLKFSVYFDSKVNSNKLSKKLIDVYNKWIINFEKYIPVVLLNMNDDKKIFDKNKYGISTINFEDMKSFFVDSYELILDMIAIPIGLNNIFERKEYNNFSECSNVNDFTSYYNQTKYGRTYSLVDTEPFSKNLKLNRHVRNAISHYNFDVDKGKQFVTFFDQFKSKENIVEMYFYDFALLCYENIIFITYLNELFYVLKKIKYISEGLMPNIKSGFEKINNGGK